jgi:hypothetical protein
MPRIVVDVSQVPELNEGAIPAAAADPMKKMPLAPGSIVRPATNNQPVSSSVSVSGAPADTGGIPPAMPVPATSVYTPPPARVGRPSEPMSPPLE